MSAIAGVWWRDDRPADPGTATRMLDGLAHRGPAGRAVWTDCGVTLGAATAAVLPDPPRDPADAQVLADRSGRALCFDGRIDNRDELSRDLAAAGHAPQSTADGDLVFRACAAWGADAPARLLGDFAFAFWDAPANRLICARDVRGIRPFCYRVDGPRIAWASELHALVTPPFDQPPPNEALVAEHLTCILTTTGETLFAGVYRLPPASVLVATPDSVRVAEYWRIDPRREVRYRDAREYDDHYLSLVTDAVRCRLRARGDIGILLSGGLDSSVVTGAAATVDRGAHRGRLNTYSISCPGDPNDEQPFVEDVLRQWHLEARATILPDPEVEPYEGDARHYRDLPSYPNGARSEALFAIARRQGVRLVLTGLGGDEWFTGHPAHATDLLAGGHPLRALREMRLDIASTAIPGWPHALWNTVRPLVPKPVLGAGRRLLRHSPIPPWIRPELAARVSLVERLYAAPGRFGFATRALDEMYREATQPFIVHGIEMFDRTVSSFGMETAHPFNDRRLIEFGLALPETERWAGGRPKLIVRRAASAWLPPSVRNRIGSPNYEHAFTYALRRLDARARLARPGSWFDAWVDRRQLLEAYDRIVPQRGAYDWTIWMATAIRLWADGVLEEGERNEQEQPAGVAAGRGA